jgi:hypothetical protein
VPLHPVATPTARQATPTRQSFRRVAPFPIQVPETASEDCPEPTASPYSGLVVRPVDPVTLREAAVILGCSASAVRRVLADVEGTSLRRGVLSRSLVEAVAAEVYPWWRHVHDPASYWVTGGDAAAVLGVNRARVGQLAESGRVPLVRHRDRTRLYRRAQLQTIATARAVRWGR